MKTIYKYRLNWSGLTALTLPHNFELVDFQTQDDECFMWALVNPRLVNTEFQSECTFAIFATGQPIPNEYEYRKTLHQNGYVWHLCEKVK